MRDFICVNLWPKKPSHCHPLEIHFVSPEIDEQTDLDSCRLEFVKKLRFVSDVVFLGDFKFDDDFLVYKQIREVLANDNLFVPDFNRGFRLAWQTALDEFDLHPILGE
jgi:hypothetical protein